ncbi:hypothetical protein KAR91_51840 [Candidatus Pacearchaeota archaeon]|nr:hypothetical protein [Candidatus Pacearchaeota archaeon]
MIYLNKNFKKRDYEATNIVACETLGEELPNMDHYRRAIHGLALIEKLSPLYIENNIRYYGYL